MLKRIKETLTCTDSGGKSRIIHQLKLKSHHLLHSDKSTYTYFYNQSKVKVGSLIKHILYSPSIPLLGGAALLLVLGVTINPIIDQTSKATAIEQDLGNGSKISLTILNNDTELADDATVSANANPGIVSYISNIIRINTSRIGKYYVGVQAASDGTSDLIGLNHHDTITGVGENVTPNNFGDNTWGYALTSNTTMSDSDLSYNTLPAYNTNSVIQHTSETNPIDGNHDLKLTFAAKINANKPGDHYQTKAMVSVAADFLNLTTQFLGFNNINNMQDMTPEICSAARIGETKRLKDTRDNKYYWITKLADNNCWMTQNLDLDLWNEEADAPVTLTPDTSDVTTSWQSTTGASSMWEAADASPDIVKYYDIGMYVYENPTAKLNSYCGTIDGEACKNIGWTNVANMLSSSDPNFGAKVTDNIYNAHYTIGNYYSWSAAVAGQVIGGAGEAMQSICPKGWRLPVANETGATEPFQDKSYTKLFYSYGSHTGGNSFRYGEQDIRIAPLYLTYFGNVGTSDRIRSLGTYGTYTLSTSVDAIYAYDAYLIYVAFGDNQTITYGGSGNGAFKNQGRSLRCVAR